MSGVERDQVRVKATGEVFTPTPLVQEMLDKLDPSAFNDPTNTFLDPSCGDGQFLSEVLIRKLENGDDFETALSTIYGVDLMEDNVALCRERLLCGKEELRHIVERNIVCHDGLTYDYSFNGTNLTDRELQDQQTGLVFPEVVTVKKAKETHTPDLSAFDIE
jgi:type I restriction-modification system DNA methylase subunit